MTGISEEFELGLTGVACLRVCGIFLWTWLSADVSFGSDMMFSSNVIGIMLNAAPVPLLFS